jgi:hypothetical protein
LPVRYQIHHKKPVFCFDVHPTHVRLQNFLVCFHAFPCKQRARNYKQLPILKHPRFEIKCWVKTATKSDIRESAPLLLKHLDV